MSSSLARLSIVSIVRPSAWPTATRQAQTGSPSISTVQAPQSPASQPTLTPVSPHSSRSARLSRSSGGAPSRAGAPLRISEIPGARSSIRRRLRRGRRDIPRSRGGAGADGDARLAHDVALDIEQDGDHDDRDDEVAPRAELEERRAHGCGRRGDDDRGDDLVRREGRAAIARDEFSDRQAPRPATRRDLDFGVEDQKRRDAVGRWRGVAKIAGDRAAILDLHAADFARRLFQRVKGVRQASFGDVRPGERGAEADGVWRDAERAQIFDRRYVDMAAGERSFAGCGEYIGAAGEYPRARLGEQSQSCFEIGRPRIHEIDSPSVSFVYK